MQIPSFWIGVFKQPLESFAKWKAEGVNIIINPDQSMGNTPADRRRACAASQLFYADVPQSISDLESLISDPWCAFLMAEDEPEIKADLPWINDPSFQSKLQSYVNKWKPIFDANKGRKPVFTNFGGGHVINARPWFSGELLKPFVSAFGTTDVGFDLYPISEDVKNSWDLWNVNPPNPNNDPFIVKGDIQQVYALKLMKNWFPTLGQWAYLDVQQYQALPNGRQPSAADIQLQVDQLVKNGVKGLIYFTTMPNGSPYPWDPSAKQSAWDGRNDEQRAKCKEIAFKLTGVLPPAPPVDGGLSTIVYAIRDALRAIGKILSNL